MSSLEAISGFKLEIDMVKIIVKDYTQFANSGKTIILCWILTHGRHAECDSSSASQRHVCADPTPQ